MPLETSMRGITLGKAIHLCTVSLFLEGINGEKMPQVLDRTGTDKASWKPSCCVSYLLAEFLRVNQ